MFSLVILACSTVAPVCKSFTPDDLFVSEQQCMGAAYVVAESVRQEGSAYIENFLCIDWNEQL